MSTRALLATVVLALAACGPTSGPSGATCPAGSTLTYENFGRPFVANYCHDCHTEQWLTVTAIRLDTREIDDSAAAGPMNTNTAMPEGAPYPSMTEREQLGQWLACGAP